MIDELTSLTYKLSNQKPQYNYVVVYVHSYVFIELTKCSCLFSHFLKIKNSKLSNYDLVYIKLIRIIRIRTCNSGFCL